MPTLSQRLGSFPTESRAEILPQCRRNYPLPPPINRGWCYGLREEKIESKISQKTSFSPVFLPANVLSLLSLSLPCCFFSPWRPHRNLPPPPTDGVSASPRTRILTGDRHSYREVFLQFSADSLLLHLFLSSSAQAANTATDLHLHLHNRIYHHHCHQPSFSPVAEQPPWPSLSSPSSFSFSSATFSSSSHSRLRPPSPQPTPPEPPAEPPHHDRHPHTRQLPPPCVASSFFVEAAACRIHPCMQRQNN